MIRKTVVVIAFVMAALTLSALALGGATGRASADDDQPQLPSIAVRGEGVVTAPPDTAVLRLGVSVQAAHVSDARQQAATAAAAVIAAAKADGVADADIQTVQLNISPVYDNRNNAQVLLGYRVDNVLQVKVRNLDSVGQVIDDATAAGGDATVVQGINFTIDDTTAITHQARMLAMQDAKARAADYAASAGVTLGRVLTITEETAPSPKALPVAAAPASASFAPTPIQPGNLQVDVTVTVTFLIQ